MADEGNRILDLLDDPDMVSESAYRAVHELVSDAVVSARWEERTDDGIRALVLAELDNVIDWAKRVKASIVPALVVTELPTPEYDSQIPCPDPACPGHVIEIDSGVRFNQLWVQRADGSEGDEFPVYASTGSADFETDRFACSEDLRTIDMPDDFQIEDWS